MSEESSSRIVRIFSDAQTLSRAAAQQFIDLAQQAAAADRPFTVALSGGSTPETLYELLATEPFKTQLNWENVHLFFGDERCVLPDAKDSNFRLVQQALLCKMGNVVRHVHRIPADLPGSDVAAQQYEQELQRFFKLEPGQFPRFDLILLGMGPDGHTASLFPHKPALREKLRLAVATEPGLKPFVTRITLTYPVLNNAANVLFLVAGDDKATTLRVILDGECDEETFPSQGVQPADGQLTWFVDEAAATKLKPPA